MTVYWVRLRKVPWIYTADELVYVAPTKALVNQIAAEIQARFKKIYGTPHITDHATRPK